MHKQENQKPHEKNLKQKTDMLRRNGASQESVESDLRKEESVWWEGFLKRF